MKTNRLAWLVPTLLALGTMTWLPPPAAADHTSCGVHDITSPAGVTGTVSDSTNPSDFWSLNVSPTDPWHIIYLTADHAIGLTVFGDPICAGIVCNSNASGGGTASCQVLKTSRMFIRVTDNDGSSAPTAYWLYYCHAPTAFGICV